MKKDEGNVGTVRDINTVSKMDDEGELNVRFLSSSAESSVRDLFKDTCGIGWSCDMTVFQNCARLWWCIGGATLGVSVSSVIGLSLIWGGKCCAEWNGLACESATKANVGPPGEGWSTNEVRL